MQEDETLASVRAFLDAFDVDEAAEHEPRTLVEPPANFQLHTPPARDASGSSDDSTSTQEALDWRAAGYSTLLQRRKRSEIATLRETSKELEERLAALHRVASSSGPSSSTTESSEEGKTWVGLEEKAARELRARRRAELANKQLKARLERQAQLREDIGKIIDKHQRRENAEAGTSVLGDLSVPFTAPAALPMTCWRGPRAAADGIEVLQAMYEHIDVVFGGSGVDETASCSIETVAREDGTEIRTTTPSECSVDEAMALHWRKPPRRYNGTMLHDKVSADGNSYVMEMMLPLPVRAWGAGQATTQLAKYNDSNSEMVEVDVHLQHLTRRIYEKATGRRSIVQQAVIRVPAVFEGILIREFMWTRITPTAGGSTTHLCYQIFGEDVAGVEVKAVQASTIHSLLLQTRQNHARLQNWLLDAAFTT